MITFKNVEEKDLPLIEQLYRNTREKELTLTNWPEAQKQRFITMQSMARLAEYKKSFPHTSHRIIFYQKKPAGALYLGESDHEIRVLDISLLPDFRGKGIGRNILTDLLFSAAQKNKSVSLHVLCDSPAKKLYEDLGFKKVSETNTHVYMECKS